MKKTIIIITLIIAFVGVGLFVYFNGEDYKLYDKAKELEAKGDIYAAHNTISEALKINPSNRKVISYKAQLYFLVKNDKALKDAGKGRDLAEKALARGDYSSAVQILDDALIAVDNVSSLYKDYDKAVTLQKELIQISERVVKEAPERYYRKGLDLYYSGQYERAYNILEYIIKPDQKTVKLKDEIAYKIGLDKYNSVVDKNKQDEFVVRDAINWFSKVSDSSPNNIDARMRLNKLKTYLKQ